MRKSLGLDQPLYKQYVNYLTNLAQGDLGTSLSNRQDIADQIGKRLGNTLFLAGWAAAISVPLAIFLGLLAVRYRNGIIDRMISITSSSWASGCMRQKRNTVRPRTCVDVTIA